MKAVIALVPVFDTETPHLSLAYLKSSLQHAGIECATIDFTLDYRAVMACPQGDQQAERDIDSRPELVDEWVQQIIAEEPDVVGFSIYNSNKKNSDLVAKKLREELPGVVIVYGGPDLVSELLCHIEESLKTCDYVVEGEGEDVLVELVRCIERKGDPREIKRLWIVDPDTGKPEFTGFSPFPEINGIPFPDYTDFDLSKFPRTHSLPLLFSRGCILNCSFCTNKWNHKTQRSRTGENVFAEIVRNV